MLVNNEYYWIKRYKAIVKEHIVKLKLVLKMGLRWQTMLVEILKKGWMKLLNKKIMWILRTITNLMEKTIIKRDNNINNNKDIIRYLWFSKNQGQAHQTPSQQQTIIIKGDKNINNDKDIIRYLWVSKNQGKHTKLHLNNNVIMINKFNLIKLNNKRSQHLKTCLSNI